MKYERITFAEEDNPVLNGGYCRFCSQLENGDTPDDRLDLGATEIKLQQTVKLEAEGEAEDAGLSFSGEVKLDDWCAVQVGIYGGKLSAGVYTDAEWACGGFTTDINYCPMCGRRLDDAQDD